MTAPTDAVATLVADVAIDALGALTIIALAVDVPITGAGSASPTVALADGAWAAVDIPKFGEPPPLAIDVHAGDVASARRHALELLDRLRSCTVWSIAPAF